jgi:hypothetical protein
LDEGKSPYSIGKDLAVWIEKLFEASIPQETLERRAERAKKRLGTNVPISTTPPNHCQIPEKQENPPLTDTTPKDRSPRLGGGADVVKPTVSGATHSHLPRSGLTSSPRKLV